MTTAKITSKDMIPERRELPDSLKDTNAHVIMSNMGLVTSKLTARGSADNPRVSKFGAWLGINIIPQLDEQIISPEVPLILREPPCLLIEADTLDEIGDRLKFEIDVMIDTAKDVMDGKIIFNDEGVPVMADSVEETTDADIPEGQVGETVDNLS